MKARSKSKYKNTKTAKQKRNIALFVLLALVVVAALLAVTVPPLYHRIEVAEYPLTYEEEVEKWAQEYKVDPYLVYTVIRTESGFDPKADSSAGARGLMQMTEETFDWLKPKIAPEEPLVFQSLYQPETSIRFGVYYISLCLARYNGDVATAAAAYHSGWGTVDKLLLEEENTQNGLHLTRFPFNQMNHYVNKINKSYAKYLELYA